jgi:hypothetical protein
MSRRPNETIVFSTESERDAFMNGYRLGVTEECNEVDCVSRDLNGTWSVELLKVYDEDL